MKLQSFNCPNCQAPLEKLNGKAMMFCPYCGAKIAQNDISFYKEDSKSARLETVIDSVTKIVGTKEQRMAEKQRREEKAAEEAEKARKAIPYWIAFLVFIFVMLWLLERYGL